MQKINTAHWKLLRAYKTPLILALIIHFIFIIMLAKLTPAWKNPEKTRPVAAETKMLSVSLKHTSPPLPEPVQADPVTEPDTLVKTETRTIIEQVTETVVPQEPLPQNSRTPEQSPETAPHHPARLISSEELHTQLLMQLQANQAVKNNTVLGEFSSHDLPANWTRKAVVYIPGMFKAAELPTKAIVLDQWKNMDGSLQNKIKLPNGNVVCGRRAAHNPLDIYSMPIWMYHSC